jgi:hypothetical protein
MRQLEIPDQAADLTIQDGLLDALEKLSGVGLPAE